MKRSEKISLITSILQTGNGHTARQRLQQAAENTHRSLLIIDDFEISDSQPLTDTSPVHFYDRGKQHYMSWGEAQQYTRRHYVKTIISLPAKRKI